MKRQLRLEFSDLHLSASGIRNAVVHYSTPLKGFLSSNKSWGSIRLHGNNIEVVIARLSVYIHHNVACAEEDEGSSHELLQPGREEM